jgi:hypothetical protein
VVEEVDAAADSGMIANAADDDDAARYRATAATRLVWANANMGGGSSTSVDGCAWTERDGK